MYKIQLEAPHPRPIRCPNETDGPNCYGDEYHGIFGHKQAETLLEQEDDGGFLVRKSPPREPGSVDYYTLSMRFDKQTKHFKIYYDRKNGHYLKEFDKKFESISDLVADGLVTFYMLKHAAPIIQQIQTQNKSAYHQSPYMTLNRRKLRAISNDMRKSLKLQEIMDNNCNNNNQHSSTLNVCDEKEPLLMQEEIIEIATPTSATNENFNTSSNSSIQEESELPVVYEKSHGFKIHNFKGLNWCEFCANFLWGFSAQGVKCDDCGFIAHKKCSELVPSKCVPDLKRIRGIFGTDLTTIVTLHKCQIPFIVKKCVEEVEFRGLMQEGIYRISGFADEIEALKLALDKGSKLAQKDFLIINFNILQTVRRPTCRKRPIRTSMSSLVHLNCTYDYCPSL